jgi:uncharacterized HAD superfamily protein
MKIAFDFDGVIGRQLEFSFQFPLWIWKIVVIFAKPMPGISYLRELTQKDEIIIVSSREPSMLLITRFWLWIYNIKISKVYCLGLLTDKTPTLIKENVDYFFDDKERHVLSAQKSKINVFVFTSWQQAKKIINKKAEEGLNI